MQKKHHYIESTFYANLTFTIKRSHNVFFPRQYKASLLTGEQKTRRLEPLRITSDTVSSPTHVTRRHGNKEDLGKVAR